MVGVLSELLYLHVLLPSLLHSPASFSIYCLVVLVFKHFKNGFIWYVLLYDIFLIQIFIQNYTWVKHIWYMDDTFNIHWCIILHLKDIPQLIIFLAVGILIVLVFLLLQAMLLWIVLHVSFHSPKVYWSIIDK